MPTNIDFRKISFARFNPTSWLIQAPRREHCKVSLRSKIPTLKMCKAYYAVFPCGHAIKLRISNCYPNFTCKDPEREEVDAPADVNCHQCRKVPAPKLDQPDVSQGSASEVQNLTSESELTPKVLTNTPPMSKGATAVVEPTTKVYLYLRTRM